jgi:hypothetical protein
LPDQLGGVGRGFRRLGLIVFNQKVDLVAIDTAFGIETVDIDAEHLDYWRLRRSAGAGHRSGHTDRIGIGSLNGRERHRARGRKRRH